MHVPPVCVPKTVGKYGKEYLSDLKSAVEGAFHLDGFKNNKTTEYNAKCGNRMPTFENFLLGKVFVLVMIVSLRYSIFSGNRFSSTDRRRFSLSIAIRSDVQIILCIWFTKHV